MASLFIAEGSAYHRCVCWEEDSALQCGEVRTNRYRAKARLHPTARLVCGRIKQIERLNTEGHIPVAGLEWAALLAMSLTRTCKLRVPNVLKEHVIGQPVQAKPDASFWFPTFWVSLLGVMGIKC